MTLLLGSVLRAHDPYDSWSSATLFPDRLELQVTMAQSTALRLVDPENTIHGLTPEVFEKNRGRFDREAPALYVVTAGRARLAPKKVSAEFTEENDVVFKLTYARPSAGRLHFHAAFLVKLGEGYGGILDLAEAGGKDLGWEQLAWASPNFEVNLSAPEKKKS